MAKAISISDFCMPVTFVRIHIIYRFGISETIAVDEGQPFNNVTLHLLYAKYHIEMLHSLWYHASTNGLAQAFKKNRGQDLRINGL